VGELEIGNGGLVANAIFGRRGQFAFQALVEPLEKGKGFATAFARPGAQATPGGFGAVRKSGVQGDFFVFISDFLVCIIEHC